MKSIRASLAGVCVLLAGLIFWQGAAAGGSPEGANVRLRLTAGKGNYAKGEPIALRLRVLNESTRTVRLSFRDSQRYDLVVQDADGQPLWRWSADQMFAQRWGEEHLQPGGQLSYRVTIRQQFPPGQYTILGSIPAEEGPFEARVTIRIK